MVSRDHKLSMRKQCALLQLSRSGLYYQPVGEGAENLRFMEIIDKQFLETPWYGSRQMARYAAQPPPMWPSPRASSDAGHEAGSDLSGTQYEQEASPALDLAVLAEECGDRPPEPCMVR